MKYKIISLLVVLLSLIICFLGNYHVNKLNKNRTEQHIDMNFADTCTQTDDFCTHLPIISIDTNQNKLNTTDLVKAEFQLYYKENESNMLLDDASINSKIEIKYRGNSSLRFDKHQYLIKFINEKGNEKKVSLLGMNEENKWILNGPFLDKTLIRNYLAYNISGKIMEHVPEVRFCEVFIDNEYQGLYVLTESISRTLTSITRYKPNWSNGMSSYIIRLDRFDANNVMIDNFSKYTGMIIPENKINIIYPSEKDLKYNIVNYITEDFSKFEKVLYSYDYHNYDEYIDVDSFVDYMIINEFFKNSDAGTYSTYLYKDVRGKIHMGPVWDFNNMANNYIETEFSHKDFSFQDKIWYGMLLKDEKFVDKVINRYKELRKSYLSEDYIDKYIDDVVNYLGSSIDRNYEVWGYTFDKKYKTNMLKPYDRNYHSYNEALEQLKDYLRRRGQWLDNNIDTLKQYCHPSINKAYEGA